MAFDGSEGGFISLSEAADYTKNYRSSVPAGSTIAHFFGKEMLEDLLKQTGCVGIRAYYGQEDNGFKNLILVGVTADQNDMVNGLIGDRSVLCPSLCSTKNSLNND
jgi:hypothetical protein